MVEIRDADVESVCATVSGLIYAGRFDEAQEELGILWPGIGALPELEFSSPVNAELLLQCGTLTSWLGSAKQVDVQERAKNLITYALEIFQELKNRIKIAEAQYELGLCYWRTGELDEARIILRKAMELGTHEQRGKILVRQTLVEVSAGRYYEALQMLDSARTSFESYPHALKGRWHGQKALILKKLANEESRKDYYDRAIVEYTAASFHLEQAGHELHCANALNNLGFLFYKMGKYREAHDYLDRARNIVQRLGELSSLAQFDEARARVLIAEERYREAELVIEEVVRTLKKGGEQALLTDALTTKATVLARLGYSKRSIETFNQAIKTGEVAGSRCSAGLAAIGLIEEHGMSLSIHEIFQAYKSADNNLSRVQDAEAIDRLRSCARIFAGRLCEWGKDFRLPDAVKDYEAHFIQKALEEEGRITFAARKLGITHQGLAFILDNRQFKFFDKRTPPRHRRRSIFKKEKD